MDRRTLLAGALAAPASVAVAGSPAAASTPSFPALISLPNGWQPEGITAGRGTTFYVGSIADGGVYRGDVRTGQGAVFIPGRAGNQAVGLEFDVRGRLWVCGGVTGGATVYDGATGAVLAEYAFGGTFVNDVVVTDRAAYFTDSEQPFLYVVPLGRGGRLPGGTQVRRLPLTGDLGATGAFNNGIETTPDGRLVIVQMLADRLVTFDPRNGQQTTLDLGGASVLQGDGLLRRGRHLYVVRNFLNVIAKFRFQGPERITLVNEITSPQFQIPATVAAFGPFLYAVNARFDLEAPTPETTYTVVRVRG